MKINQFYANLNSLMLFLIILSVLLYQTLVGGPDSIYNTAVFLLVCIFLLMNARFNKILLIFFLIPTLFLFTNALVNNFVIDSGGMHTVCFVTAGYLMLSVSMFRMDKGFFKKLIIYTIFLNIFVSLWYHVHNIGVISSLYGFCLNPNSESLYLFSLLLLSIIFIKSWIRWICFLFLLFLILETASRTGFFVSMILMFGCLFFDKDKKSYSILKFFKTKKKLFNLIAFVFILALIIYLMPILFHNLFERLKFSGISLSSQKIGGHGRDDIWRYAFDLLFSSKQFILFGIGPGNAQRLLGTGIHSSYVEAIVAEGWGFFITTMIALFWLIYYHYKRGHYFFIWIAFTIFLYGLFEAVLLNGMNSIWGIFIILSLYYRSCDTSITTKPLYNELYTNTDRFLLDKS